MTCSISGDFIHECLKQVHESPHDNFKQFCYLGFNAEINFILFYLLAASFYFATLRTELPMRTKLLARPPITFLSNLS